MRRNEYDDEPYFVIEQPGNGVGIFLLGLALGTGAALLLAPRTGEETRQMLGSKARDMRDSARQMVDEFSDNIQSTFADAKDRVTDQVDEARSAVRRGKRQVHNAMDAGRSAAHEARAELDRKLSENRPVPRDDEPFAPEATT